ncbi:MAG: hypothetical protein ACPG4T_10885 [Nannocystaceae bacterium]
MSNRVWICLGVWMLASCSSSSQPAVSQPVQNDPPPAVAPAPTQPAPTAPTAPKLPKEIAPDQPSTNVEDPRAPGTPHPAHRCKANADCTNSCSLGAVNTHWYAIHYPDGDRCQDGCTSKGFEAPQCHEGSCVAYQMGKRVEECTQLAPAYPKGRRIRPEHSCQVREDCTTTCQFGAVNQKYYTAHKQDFPDCRDGCSSKGTDSPECQEGLCVGYRFGNPDPLCTSKPMVATP